MEGGSELTIASNVMKMTTAKLKKAMKAFAWIDGCRDCIIFTMSRPPMMNMKAVSAGSHQGHAYPVKQSSERTKGTHIQ